MLDQYCETTGLNRKYVIRLLSPRTALSARVTRPRKKRLSTYGNEETYYLKKIWEILDYPCSVRLAPMLEPMIEKLRNYHELLVPDSVALKLATIAPSTIDQKLKRFRAEIRRRVNGTTKPGSFLKKQIPIRTSSWEESRAGYTELDTVAHCGDHAGGDFANTLNITDLLTGWSEQEAVMGKAEKRIKDALNLAAQRFPFPLRGIDPDNGSEFINWQLFRWCMEQKIEFTRGRPYHKNDNAHIEQKNWTHVRKVFGYARIESDDLVDMMNDLYRNELRLYKNFFQPVMKLVDKKRVGRHGEKIKRIYDVPQTPHQRVVRSAEVAMQTKDRFRAIYDGLNPAALRRSIIMKLKKFNDTLLRERQQRIRSKLHS